MPSVNAQGTVNLNNRVVGAFVTHIYGPLPAAPTYVQTGNGSGDTPVGTQDWTGFGTLSGSRFMAALLSAPGTADPEADVRFGTPVTTFRTGGAAGWVSGVEVTLANVPGGGPSGTLEVFTWDNGSGDYADPTAAWGAWKSGIIAGGTSAKVVLGPFGGGATLPPLMLGWQSFNMYMIFPTNQPSIIRQPVTKTAPVGTTVLMSVRATGSSLSYQWFFNGTNAVPGATNNLLYLIDVRLSQSGSYTVVVSSDAGSITSQPAALSVVPTLDLRMVPSITLRGDIGSNLRIDYISVTGPTTDWVALATVTMTNTSQLYFDLSAGGQPQRYYRLVQVP